MQELDSWTNATIIMPLYKACRTGSEDAFHEAAAAIERSIRAKVLESYRNGQSVGIKPGKGGRHGS